MPDVASIGTHSPWDSTAWPTAGDVDLDSVAHQHKSNAATRHPAGPMPLDADVDEVCDSFPATESIGYDCLGVAERFCGVMLVDAEATAVDRWLPLNPGRGLTAKACPRGVARVGQCVELFRKPARKAVNPVGGARIVLAHSIGGPTTRPTVSFLEGPAASGS